jgi:carbamoyl-phosphate synthase large subunit
MAETLCVAITGGGAPQSPTLIRHLKNNGERPVKVVAFDMDEEASGRFLADDFRQIPPAGVPGYKERLMEVLVETRPDALLNVSGADVRVVSGLKQEIEAMGIACLCSDAEAVAIADNKYELYSLANRIEGVSAPEFRSPKSLDEFVTDAKAMGYPERDLCFKPHIGKGSRGFRILSERFDRRDLLLNHKPTARYITLDEFVSIFSGRDEFPDLLLMEVAEGEEIDAMTIAYDGEALLTTCKTRESHRWGVIDRASHVDRPELKAAIAALVKHIPLRFNISIQFIGDKIIEINPRTSTFIYQDDLNEPWLAVKLGLGLITPEDVRAHSKNVRYGRRMVRLMDQIFFEEDGSWAT